MAFAIADHSTPTVGVESPSRARTATDDQEPDHRRHVLICRGVPGLSLPPPDWSKKTYNNAISVIRHAFQLGYRDNPELHDPALGLRIIRIKRKDRPKIDPFSIHDSETLIAAIHRDWGEARGNYDEFRFFTGLRPSEQIALTLADVDIERGLVRINKACVAGVEKDCTKTREDRSVYLCPRAMEVLEAQLNLRAQLARTGHIDHTASFSSRRVSRSDF